MADNTDEEHLDNPTKKQSKNLSGQAISPNNKENINHILESGNMEVHHHAHDPAAPHHKKNWKSYLWEFLMLFLAVFCGFMAEYFLEHLIERERGNQYVQSMMEDIKSDSKKIDKSIEFCIKQKAGIDSLSILFNNLKFSDSDIKMAYLLMSNYTNETGTVNFTKRTISQLKNSGGMRLISNKISADEITKYSEFVEIVEFQGNYFNNHALNELIKLNKKIFFLTYINEIKSKSIDNFITASPIKFACDDRNLLVEYNNSLILTSGVLQSYIGMLTSLKIGTSATLEILKKENHIR